MRVRRWSLLLAVLVCLCPISFAQTSDWAIVTNLAPGQKVKVETRGGKSYVGKVQSITDDELRIAKDQLLQRQDVQRVQLWSSGHHGRNALIGLGAGAGVGAIFGAASCGGTDAWFTRGECAAVSAPFFGGLGAAIGAVVPSHGKWREVYLAK